MMYLSTSGCTVKPHPLNKDTSLLRTVSMVPSVSDQQGLTVIQLFPSLVLQVKFDFRLMFI